MHVRLTVMKGSRTGQLDLCLPTIMGRGNSAKLKLPSSTVSRQHCEIYEYEGQIAIRDLGSSNGTIVNGHRIEGPTFITPSDLVAVGPVSFRLEIVAVESFVAPAKEDVFGNTPKLSDIPNESAPPRQPTLSDTHADNNGQESEAAFEEELAGSAWGGSVLRYGPAEKDGDRSFVGIVTDENTEQSSVSATPAIETASDVKDVSNDDSSLRNFFDSLDS